MKTRTRIISIASTAVVAAATGLALTTTAHALSNNGVCNTNSQCWRASTSSYATDAWARDISGDTLQHVDSFNYGTVAQTGCLYNLPQSIQNSFAGNQVHAYRDATGYYVGARSGAYLSEDPSGSASDWYDFWVTASGTGALINCGQSDYWKALDSLCYVPNYTQLYARGSCLTDLWNYVSGG